MAPALDVILFTIDPLSIHGFLLQLRNKPVFPDIVEAHIAKIFERCNFIPIFQ
jgi:hypothetical protein